MQGEEVQEIEQPAVAATETTGKLLTRQASATVRRSSAAAVTLALPSTPTQRRHGWLTRGRSATQHQDACKPPQGHIRDSPPGGACRRPPRGHRRAWPPRACLLEPPPRGAQRRFRGRPPQAHLRLPPASPSAWSPASAAQPTAPSSARFAASIVAWELPLAAGAQPTTVPFHPGGWCTARHHRRGTSRSGRGAEGTAPGSRRLVGSPARVSCLAAS
jgi:hypothetical protein